MKENKNHQYVSERKTKWGSMIENDSLDTSMATVSPPPFVLRLVNQQLIRRIIFINGKNQRTIGAS